MKSKNLLILVIIVITSNISLVVNSCSAQYQKLFTFDSTALGKTPYGNLVSDGTYLYGLASAGGNAGAGVLFKIKLDGTGYKKLVDFIAIKGSNPQGSLLLDGTDLYGMTNEGGASGAIGTIFKVKTDSTGFLKLHDFMSSDGTNPYGSLVSDGTFLYGMTNTGGANGLGTSFKIKKDGTGFAKISDFAGPNGSSPYGDFVYDGTYLYAPTYYGGSGTCFAGCGMVLKIKPDGTGFDSVLTFNTANGKSPRGSLIYDGTYLYGTTQVGGSHALGNLFKVKPDRTGYVDMHDFSGFPSDGANPFGSVVSDGTTLYGMTNTGGANSVGSLFKINKDGTGYTKLMDFATGSGRKPYGTPIIVGNALYGMTSEDSTGHFGTIFKYSIPVGIDELSAEMGVNIFPNPFTNELRITCEKKGDLFLYDLEGKEILHQKAIAGETKINTEKIASGFYLIKYTDGTRAATGRIVKF